jgi:hypothetical protein
MDLRRTTTESELVTDTEPATTALVTDTEPATTALVTDTEPATTALVNGIGSMMVTYPLTRCLGVYHNPAARDGVPSYDLLVARICNDDGVRVSELLETINRVASEVLSTWRRRLQTYHDKMATKFHRLDNVGGLPGAPRLIMLGQL